MKMPPPSGGEPTTSTAVLSLIVLSRMVALLEAPTRIPAPSFPEFPLIVELVIVTVLAEVVA